MSKIPDGPWLELSCDLMDLPKVKYVLILVDDYSRYPLVEILNSVTSRAVIQSLGNMLSMFGTPKKIRTDNGPCFISKEFKEFSKYIGFKHRKMTLRWPRAKGEAERMVRTLKKTILICRSENRSFTQALHRFLRNYRATPHPSTGETPAILVFGNPMHTRLPEVTEITPNLEVIDRDIHQKEIMKDNAESRLKLVTEESRLQIGDTVLLRRKGIVPKELTPYDPDPFKVIAKMDQWSPHRGMNRMWPEITFQENQFWTISSWWRSHRNHGDGNRLYVIESATTCWLRELTRKVITWLTCEWPCEQLPKLTCVWTCNLTSKLTSEWSSELSSETNITTRATYATSCETCWI